MRELNLFSFGKVLVLLCLLGFLLSACSSGGSGSAEGVFETDFKQGYDGIIISLVEGSPNDVVTENSEWKIEADIHNAGAYTARNLVVTFAGLLEQYAEIDARERVQNIVSLEGRMLGAEDAAGEKERVEASMEVKELDAGRPEKDMSFHVVVDYDYSNEFLDTFCVNPSTHAVHDGGCKVPSEPSRYVGAKGGQGSPLAVVEVEEIINAGASTPLVEFKVSIENEGKGVAGDILLLEARLGHDDLDCAFKGGTANTFTFEKTEQEVLLICSKVIDVAYSVPSTLYINYDFSYQEFVAGEFTIEEGIDKEELEQAAPGIS